MERITLVGEDAAPPDVRPLFAVLRERFDKVPNLFAAMAHAPAAMRPVLDYFDAVYARSELSERLRELVLVQVAFGLQSHYCLTLHKAFALERGATIAELKALRDDPELAPFTEEERVVLRYAAAYARDAREIPDDLYGELRARFSEAQIVSLSLLVSLALLFGDLANALHIPVDAILKAPRSPDAEGPTGAA